MMDKNAWEVQLLTGHLVMSTNYNTFKSVCNSVIEALCDFVFTLLKAIIGPSVRFAEHWALLLYCAVHIHDLQFKSCCILLCKIIGSICG